MSDIKKWNLLVAEEFKVEAPGLKIPANSPNWVQHFYPSLIVTMYNGFNSVVENMVAGVNDCLVDLQSQISDLTKKLDQSDKQLASLKESILEKESADEEQNVRICNIQDSLEKNESYSRRNNLIFGNIDKDDQRSCEVIIKDICSKHLSLSNETTSSINFVRCHYLNKKPSDRTNSIIARFESYDDRSRVWECRRKLSTTKHYMTEDFPVAMSKRRNKLRPILKKASQSQDYQRKISMKGDKIIFNGIPHGVDDLGTLPEPIHPRTLSEKKTDSVFVFGGVLSQYHEFSNFYKCPIRYKGKIFNCVEQCYQWSKAMLFNDHRTARAITSTTDPARQKYLSKHISGFVKKNWLDKRDHLMEELLTCKFSQNPECAKKLCDSGTLLLGEAISYDNYWGTGMSIVAKNTTTKKHWGQNKLGKLLMKIRGTVAV